MDVDTGLRKEENVRSHVGVKSGPIGGTDRFVILAVDPDDPENILEYTVDPGEAQLTTKECVMAWVHHLQKESEPIPGLLAAGHLTLCMVGTVAEYCLDDRVYMRTYATPMKSAGIWVPSHRDKEGHLRHIELADIDILETYRKTYGDETILALYLYFGNFSAECIKHHCLDKKSRTK